MRLLKALSNLALNVSIYTVLMCSVCIVTEGGDQLLIQICLPEYFGQRVALGLALITTTATTCQFTASLNSCNCLMYNLVQTSVFLFVLSDADGVWINVNHTLTNEEQAMKFHEAFYILSYKVILSLSTYQALHCSWRPPQQDLFYGLVQVDVQSFSTLHWGPWETDNS